MPDLLRILIPRYSDGGGRHGRVLGYAFEAERVARRSCPRERGDNRQAVFRPVSAERHAAVAAPLLHRVWHVHIQAEVGCEHAIVAAQNAKVRARGVPKPLELVIVDEEVAALAALLVARRALRVIEALKLIRLRARLRDAWEPVPAAVSPRADVEVVRVIGTQPLRAVRQNLGLELQPEAAHDSLVQRERELLIFPNLVLQGEAMRAVLHCGSFEVAVLAVEVSRTVADDDHVLALGINGGLGYLMVSASLSPVRMRLSKSVRNLIPMEWLSAITNSVPR